MTTYAGNETPMSLLHAHTSLPTLTLVGVILWAVLSSVIALTLWRRSLDAEGR